MSHTRLLVGGALECLVLVCEIELILSLWAVHQVTKLPVLYCGLETCMAGMDLGESEAKNEQWGSFEWQ